MTLLEGIQSLTSFGEKAPERKRLLTPEYRAQLQRESEIIWMDELETTTTPHGEITRFGFVTENGHSYAALVTKPFEQLTDVPVLSTTPWIASTEGHTEHIERHLLQIGAPGILVGAEGSLRPPKEYTKDNPRPTLAASAAAMYQFTNIIKPLMPHLSAESVTVFGESRAAMIGLGLVALEEDFNQKVLYADLVAPCFPRGLEPVDLLEIPKQLAREPLSLFKLIGRVSQRAILHYPSTIDPHPMAIKQQIRTIPALLGAEAGDLAREITSSTPIHITCFNGDFISMCQEWEALFTHHPNVQITPLDGQHLTICDPETLDFIKARYLAFATAYQSKLQLSKTSIFNLAHWHKRKL